MVINEVKSLFKGTDDKQKDFGWYEFTLEELGLPSVDKILVTGIKLAAKNLETVSAPSEYKNFHT